MGRLTLSDFFLFGFHLGMWLENRQWLLFLLGKDPLTMHELSLLRGFAGERQSRLGLAQDELG